MQFLKKIKWPFYVLKIWTKLAFTYGGITKLNLAENLDYDLYWQNKRQAGAGDLSPWQMERARIIVTLLANDPSSISIGDIAGGEGSILKYIADHHTVGKRIVYDNSKYILEVAAESGAEGRFLDLSPNAPLDSLEDADYFLLLEILEHIPHSEVVLTAAYEKAGKGVFFSFPNSGFFVYRLRLLFGKFPKQWVKFPNEHIRFWTLQDLRWWLSALGLRDRATIIAYKGVPILNRIYPALFSAGFVVLVKK